MANPTKMPRAKGLRGHRPQTPCPKAKKGWEMDLERQAEKNQHNDLTKYWLLGLEVQPPPTRLPEQTSTLRESSQLRPNITTCCLLLFSSHTLNKVSFFMVYFLPHFFFHIFCVFHCLFRCFTWPQSVMQNGCLGLPRTRSLPCALRRECLLDLLHSGTSSETWHQNVFHKRKMGNSVLTII